MGPLDGFKVVEMGAIGPGPMCAMLLADMGATVIRIDRPEPTGLGVPKDPKFDLLLRGRQLLALDLKRPDAVALVLRLVEQADALIEGFRPGVMERLGLGPEACFARRPALAYGRMTGWGQDGPMAQAVGHDLNYLGLSGALAAMGRRGALPSPPLNLVADYGGALYLAGGILAAAWRAQRSGQGQVVDAAMADTCAHLMTNFFGLAASGRWRPERGTNILDSGAFFYDVFECRDGGLISVAPIEERFYRDLLRRLELDPAALPRQDDHARWPEGRAVLAARFLTRTRDEWVAFFEGSEACVAPVLSMAEAPQHPHYRARGSFIEVAGVVQPAPAPRFSRTPSGVPAPPATRESCTPETALAGWLGAEEIAALRAAGTLGRGETQ